MFYKLSRKKSNRKRNKYKNEKWDRIYKNIKSMIGFSRAIEEWLVLKSFRKETKYKSNLLLMPMNDQIIYFQKLLVEEKEEFSQNDIDAIKVAEKLRALKKLLRTWTTVN